MGLERYRFQRIKAVAREYDHLARRQRQASLAAVLCVAYDEFHKMTLARTCSDAKTTYQEAERLSELFGGLFDMDIPVATFLPNESLVDDAIEHYKKYAEYRNVAVQFGYQKEDVDAFFKQIEHAAYKIGLQRFFAFNSIGYVYNMRAVYDYLCGTINEKQLQEALFIFIPPDMKPMTDRDKWYFAKTMFRLLREFEEIVRKRARRFQKHKLC